jgi:predicted transposase YdaD
MHDYDTSCKWMIQHYAAAILRLAGFRNIASWKPLQAEPVHPRRLPDGLIEVQQPGGRKPIYFVLEASSYPYKRLAKQASDDALLVYLERGVVPEVVALVLHPRGKRPTPSKLVLPSEAGFASIHVYWKVVELWTIPAEELLATGDVGLIPWVPLAQFEGSPEPIFRECRTRLERDAPPAERESLLVATHFLAGLRYNDPGVFQLLGGSKAMIKVKSPLIREIIEEANQEGKRETKEDDVVTVLVTRFGAKAKAVKAELKKVRDDRLEALLALAVTCPDLDAFRKQLVPRRGKRGV